MRIDLHLHSTTSDGSLTPGALVAAAREGGLDIIAVTDHDTAVGVPAAVAEAAGTLHVIPGIEVSSTHDGAELHLLGYYIEPLHSLIAAYAQMAGERRRERMHGMLGRLRSLGVVVEYEEVAAAMGTHGGAMGRPHLARALMERGYVHSFADAFDRYIGDHGPAFLPTDLLTPREAIDLIHDAGGLAVWAHPRIESFDNELPRLRAWGLDGVECFRPRCSPSDSLHLEARSRSLGLVATGGSDWHGTWHGRLGGFCVSREEVGPFLERGGI